MSAPDDLLGRTRSAVLNVMIVAGTGIAVSGWLLRWHDRWALQRAPAGVARGLMAALLAASLASFVVRRASSGGGPARYYRGHVLAACLGSLGVPLGLAYGWLVRPRLDVVGPFWVVALTLGLLALPRAHEPVGPDPEPDRHGPQHGASQSLP